MAQQFANAVTSCAPQMQPSNPVSSPFGSSDYFDEPQPKRTKYSVYESEEEEEEAVPVRRKCDSTYNLYWKVEDEKNVSLIFISNKYVTQTVVIKDEKTLNLSWEVKELPPSAALKKIDMAITVSQPQIQSLKGNVDIVVDKGKLLLQAQTNVEKEEEYRIVTFPKVQEQQSVVI